MNATVLRIRAAETGDAEAIAAIYNHYVLHSNVTFDTEPKTVADRITWLENHGPAHPVLVAELDGRVVAWGSVSPYRDRPAWQYTVEMGVYVEPGITGGGVGPRLLDALVQAARDSGHHVALAQITADNEPSLKMSERAGFQRVGLLAEAGFKFGSWIDLVILRLEL